MAFLELHQVHKGYDADPSQVLRGVDLAIERGELVAVVGRSGSGKTTLLSLAAGLIRPSRGAVRCGGRDVAGPGPDRAVVFQSYSLLPWLTVRGNIQLAVDRVHADWPKARRQDKADEYVALVNLTAARDKRPAQLSGGMRQRVALARALAMEPDVLLMDEPLAALDALTRASLQDEIERIWSRQRTTALLVTNDVDEAIRLADRIVPVVPAAGGGSTLGDAIPVPLPRPRDRRVLLRDAGVHALRARVVARLRQDGAELAPEVVDERVDEVAA
jgi:nitrate/nitrite transport system ATP-binding protein